MYMVISENGGTSKSSLILIIYSSEPTTFGVPHFEKAPLRINQLVVVIEGGLFTGSAG